MKKFKRVLSMLMVLMMLVSTIVATGITSNAAGAVSLWVYLGDCSSYSLSYTGWAHASPWMAAAFVNNGSLKNCLNVNAPNGSGAYNDLFGGKIKPPSGYTFSGTYFGSDGVIYSESTSVSITDGSILYLWPIWHKATTFNFTFDSGTVSGYGTSTSITAYGEQINGVQYNLEWSDIYSANKSKLDALFSAKKTGYVLSGYKYTAFNDTLTKSGLASASIAPSYQGTTYTLNQDWNPCSHSSYTTNTSPTCSTTGKGTCNTCGASVTIPATGVHSYTSSVTTSPTCSTTGIRTYKCSNCSSSYTESIAATGSHTYNTWTSQGSYEVCKCATCSDYNQKRFTVTYNANGGTAGSATTQTVTYNTSSNTTTTFNTAANVVPTPPAGKTFAGWSTSSTATSGSTSITAGSNTTLYAVYTDEVYDLILDANGGTFSDGNPTKIVKISYGQTYRDAMGLDTFPTPTRDGYEFQYFDYENGVFGLHEDNWDREPYGLTTGYTMTAVWKEAISKKF